MENSSKAEYHPTKIEWKNFQIKKAEAAIFWSKSKWVESGEKNTKYFLNLEKQNCNGKYIKKLLGQNERTVTKPEDILNEEKQSYEELYTTRNANERTFATSSFNFKKSK